MGYGDLWGFIFTWFIYNKSMHHKKNKSGLEMQQMVICGLLGFGMVLKGFITYLLHFKTRFVLLVHGFIINEPGKNKSQ